MMLSCPVRRRNLAAQVAGFVLEAKGLVHLAHGAAQLIHQFVVLDHIAVGAGIDGGNGGLDRGHAGDQEEIAGRRNLLAELQKFDARGVRHADVGNHDVKNLRFELPAGGLAVHGHFDAVAFLAKGDLQQFADGAFVVDDQNMSHETASSSLQRPRIRRREAAPP